MEASEILSEALRLMDPKGDGSGEGWCRAIHTAITEERYINAEHS